MKYSQARQLTSVGRENTNSIARNSESLRSPTSGHPLLRPTNDERAVYRLEGWGMRTNGHLSS